MRLDPRPPSVVVGRRRWQGDEAALFEERRDGVREQDLGGDPVRFVLCQAAVRVPAPVRGRSEEVREGVDVGSGPGVELVVPARCQIRPVVGDVTAGVSVRGDDGVPVIRRQFRRDLVGGRHRGFGRHLGGSVISSDSFESRGR